jgi:hypothetical protein
MPPRYPPRREPRVLAIIRSNVGFQYATADPWELRAAGSATCQDRALGPTVARLVRREKPTLLVARGAGLREAGQRACRRYGPTYATAPIPALPPPIAQDMYPELPMRAPTPSLEKVATLAIAAVLYTKNSTRHYAPRRKRSTEHAP